MKNGEKMHVNSIMSLMIMFSFMVFMTDKVSIKYSADIQEKVFIALRLLHLVIISLLIILKKIDILKMYKLKSINKKLVLVSFTTGFLIMFFTGSITQLIESKINVSNESGEISKVMFIFIVILAGFIAPIIEEIEFRGLLFGKLQHQNKLNVSAILIVSFMFMILHTGTIHISAMILSIVSCIMYYYTRNLLYSSITHFSGNIILVLISLIVIVTEKTTEAVTIVEDTTDVALNYEVSYVAVFIEIILLIALIVFVVYYFKKFKTRNENNLLESTESVNKVFTSRLSRGVFIIQFFVYTIICIYCTYILIKKG